MSPTKKSAAKKPRPPTAEEIAAKRIRVDLTQQQAADLIRRPLRTWQDWEYGHHRMPADTWEYWSLLAEVPAVAEARDAWLKRNAKSPK